MKVHPLYFFMKFTIKTIGCKVNTYESNKIRDSLVDIGFEYVDVRKKEEYVNLDYYIVNTCSVTKIADKKSRQMLHLAKKYNPNVKVIAIGCMVDSLNKNSKSDKKEIDVESSNDESSLKGIDFFFSNKEKMKLAEFLTSKIDKSNLNAVKKENKLAIRSFIKVQDGCNQYCTYCIIPFLRGNIKSRDDSDIISEVSKKADLGVREVVLTGIHLSSFGLDRKGLSYENDGAISEGRNALLSLIKKIALIGGISRIRLGSLEPRIISDEFLQTLINEVGEKFCGNFCLSLQSGCDKTLKRMNRHYSTPDFETACNLIRKHMPYATITTDVIVGFPGETEDDFNESLEFVKRMRFYNPNIFPYSRRPGTKADQMDNQISNTEKHKRVAKMIDECEKISRDIEKEYFENYSDRASDVLIEEYEIRDGKSYGVGYTKEYFRVFV